MIGRWVGEQDQVFQGLLNLKEAVSASASHLMPSVAISDALPQAATTVTSTSTELPTLRATTPASTVSAVATPWVDSGSYRYPYDPGSDAFNAKPLECLRLTTPGLQRFEYPDDAEAHFEELNRTMSAFTKGVRPLCGKITAGYCGPWIENHWIWTFSAKWKNRPNGTRLRDIFGPYIPILFPFLDIWIPHFYRYPPGIIETLNQTMRRNVLYIALSQSDDSLFGHNLKHWGKFTLQDFPNLLLMSAGGYGHVPLPLFKQTEDPVHAPPIMDRPYAVSFMGSLNHGPAGTRTTMKSNAESWGRLRNKSVLIGKGENWREVMANTSLNLSPRGFGRNSYRTLELFQKGLIPIYIHAKGPWLFYRDLWVEEKIGFYTTPDSLGWLLDRAFSNVTKLLDIEKRIRAMRQTHFMPTGILDQISKFMTERDGGGDLRCQALPDSVL